MHIIYVANVRIPTEKAHGLQIMKMCESFASLGHTVELLAAGRKNPLREQDPFEYYNINTRFAIRHLPTFDIISLGKLGFWVESFTYAFSVAWYMLFKKPDVVYGRDEQALFYVSLTKKNVVLEVHHNTYNFFARHLMKRCAHIITITKGLKDFYTKQGVDDKKIMVAPDAFDERLFAISVSKYEARAKLSLPLQRRIVIYTGHLYGWKGAQYVAEAASSLPLDVLVYFVGGTKDDIARFTKEYGSQENIRIVGHRPYDEIPYWQRSADVLVLPNTAKFELSRLYTSPAKLFEYMRSGRPIVASNIPSLSEILNNTNAVLVTPDNVEALKDGILELLRNTRKAQRLASQAKCDVKEYTWDKRAKSILVGISK